MRRLIIFLVISITIFANKIESIVLDKSIELNQLHRFEFDNQSYEIKLPKGYKAQEKEEYKQKFYEIEYGKVNIILANYKEEELEELGDFFDDKNFYQSYKEAIDEMNKEKLKFTSNIYRFESESYYGRGMTFSGRYFGFRYNTHYIDLLEKKLQENFFAIVFYKNKDDEKLWQNIIATLKPIYY